ncbi:Segregation and condensation protein A [Chlamydiales bacterium SCGC AB-751-O23]|jgi:segregation and condensation protein A|nr:Segregation and condensation protein A [Chlamydiales bacterium SCGC AB-751-O23]
MLKSFEDHLFHLKNFQGPLDFLLYLAQKKEVDLTRIFIKNIIEEYLEVLKSRGKLSIDAGGEFLSLTSYLLFLKSQALLPSEKKDLDPDELDPKFDVIHHILDYCQFKDAAKSFSQREREEHAFFYRGGLKKEAASKKGKGLKYLELQELSGIFDKLLQKSAGQKFGNIEDETFLVSDKIKWLKDLLSSKEKIHLETVFDIKKSKEELIVTFLATLELVKYQFLLIFECLETKEVFMIKKCEETNL